MFGPTIDHDTWNIHVKLLTSPSEAPQTESVAPITHEAPSVMQ
jgi:hypothetical protein